jgi:hypothetical protein
VNNTLYNERLCNKGEIIMYVKIQQVAFTMTCVGIVGGLIMASAFIAQATIDMKRNCARNRMAS